MISIKVRLFSDFRIFAPEKCDVDLGFTYNLQNGSSVRVLLELLGVTFNKPMVVTVNDTTSNIDVILNDGDVVKVFPVAMGG